jgi:hypothetical protein
VSKGDPGNWTAVARTMSGRAREVGWRQHVLAGRLHVSTAVAATCLRISWQVISIAAIKSKSQHIRYATLMHHHCMFGAIWTPGAARPRANGLIGGVSDADPAWAWWIDEHELTWQEAMVQRDLGLASLAITQFERSLAATPATEIRGQYIHRAYLLQAQVDNATWNAAAETIRQLLPLSTEVASTRTVVLLRNILRQLEVRDKVPLALREHASLLSTSLDEAR